MLSICLVKLINLLTIKFTLENLCIKIQYHAKFHLSLLNHTPRGSKIKHKEIHKYANVCTHKKTQTNKHIHRHTYTHSHTHTHTHTHTDTHTHTHTQTHIHTLNCNPVMQTNIAVQY